MIIHVRRKHIKQGVQGDPKNCPIALAMIDCKIMHPSVCSRQVHYGEMMGRQVAHLSTRVQKFILKFDCKKSVKPFSFRLNVGKDGGR